MPDLSIFQGISAEERQKMLSCFQPYERLFSRGETISTYSSSLEQIGILLSGTAVLCCVDAEGRQSILEQFHTNDVFGEMFSLPIETLAYFVQAQSPCQVLFIDYAHVVKRCHNACEHHSQLVSNLFQLAAQRTQKQTAHIHILSQRTIREKCLTYFEFLCGQNGARDCTLPLSFSALADYLCVERSSLMREIKKLREEQRIRTEGRHLFVLY